jgi:hypothetical protein
MRELFFGLLFKAFEEITVGTKAILASDRVFKNRGFEWSKRKCHITAKENEEADARKIGKNVPHGI